MFKSTAQSHAHAHPVGGGVRGKAQLLDRPRQDRHLGGKSVKKFQIEICCRQLGDLALCVYGVFVVAVGVHKLTAKESDVFFLISISSFLFT